MKATLLRDHQGLRTFALILATDDEAMSSLGSVRGRTPAEGHTVGGTTRPPDWR